jgi:hypothetical protein
MCLGRRKAPTDSVGNLFRSGRATGNGEVGRHILCHSIMDGITSPKDAPIDGAVTHCKEPLGRGHGLVCLFEGLFHMAREGTCNQKNIRMAGGGHKGKALTRQGVDRVFQSPEFQLAPIAGAGIEMTDGGAAAVLTGGGPLWFVHAGLCQISRFQDFPK